MNCKVCGSLANADEDFCGVCGTRLERQDSRSEASAENSDYQQSTDAGKAIESNIPQDNVSGWNIPHFPRPQNAEPITGEMREEKALPEESFDPNDYEQNRLFLFSQKNEDFQKILDVKFERINERNSGRGDEKGSPLWSRRNERPFEVTRDTIPISPKDILRAAAAARAENAEAVKGKLEAAKSELMESKPEVDSKEAAVAGPEVSGKEAISIGENAKPEDNGVVAAETETSSAETAAVEAETVQEKFEPIELGAPESKPEVNGKEADIAKAETSGEVAAIAEVETAQDEPGPEKSEDAKAEPVKEESKKKPGRKGKAGWIIFAIFMGVFILAVGAKYITQYQVFEYFTGGLGKGSVPENIATSQPVENKNLLIERAWNSNQNLNIRDISANDALEYSEGRDYGEDGINYSMPIENNTWVVGEEDQPRYYDQEVVRTLIAFDSQWVDYVNKGNEIVFAMIRQDSPAYEKALQYARPDEINEVMLKLDIGEIRRWKDSFYVWAYEQLLIQEGETETTTNTFRIYRIDIVGKQMQIADYIEY